jgi:GDP-D-mannose 3',5'-epimerase
MGISVHRRKGGLAFAPMPSGRILITGGGGFIGGHLAASFIEEGRSVRVVDVKPLDSWYQIHPDAENLVADVSQIEVCRHVVSDVEEVYNLAADMGGMGFIEGNKALCMLSVLPSTQMLIVAREEMVGRFFYSSSACVYAAEKQDSPEVRALRESDAYPAMPEDGYGWEKLFSERMCRHFREDFGLETRVARYHNVYGPQGTWTGGREKAPAAICRKVAEAVRDGSGEIEIWGDGEQTRSFMYIDDCVRGTRMITDGDPIEPINLGSSEVVTINGLVDLVEGIAGIELTRRYKLDAPQGVRGRNSDNAMIREAYDWEPSISLQEGLTKTYEWVSRELERAAPDRV